MKDVENRKFLRNRLNRREKGKHENCKYMQYCLFQGYGCTEFTNYGNFSYHMQVNIYKIVDYECSIECANYLGHFN